MLVFAHLIAGLGIVKIVNPLYMVTKRKYNITGPVKRKCEKT